MVLYKFIRIWGVKMSVLKLQQGVIYGPINSRRLGRSLGINLLPTDKKVCSFDCIYCHYGRTAVKTIDSEGIKFPSKGKVLQEIERKLRKFKDFDFLTFSGNGEPTLHPDFDEIVEETVDLREKYCPDKPVAVLSNSSIISERKIRDALEKLDVRILKLDAGDEVTFNKINNPHEEITLTRIIRGLKAVKDPIIQCVMIDGEVCNAEGNAYSNWVKAISKIQPTEVQIYSTDRPVPVKQVKKVKRNKLQTLASDVYDRLGVHTIAY